MNKHELFLAEHWHEQGELVAKLCKETNSVPMSFSDFLSHCTACGGDWGAMLLSGVKALYPRIWDAIPNDMGCFAWSCIMSTLRLLNVSMPEDKE